MRYRREHIVLVKTVLEKIIGELCYIGLDYFTVILDTQPSKLASSLNIYYFSLSSCISGICSFFLFISLFLSSASPNSDFMLYEHASARLRKNIYIK